MEWLRENWFSVLVFIIFIAMHLFGHGMHGGGCGGHGGHDEEEGKEHEGHGEGQTGKKEKKGSHAALMSALFLSPYIILLIKSGG